VEIQNLVVARFLDGRVLKGVTHDFAALRPKMHLEIDGSHEMQEVAIKQLKAIFFVKTFAGYPERQDVRGFVAGPAENSQGKKIAVRFKDGELLCGYTTSWTPEREGFFMFPSDPGSNNERVYVLRAATAEIKAGPMAEALATKVLGGTNPPNTNAA
jgi:hypothetical protein